MSRIDDATLIAYVDGELDRVTIEEVEAELARDAALYAKVRQLRESTALLGAAFNHALYGPLPNIEIGPLPVTDERPSAEVITFPPAATNGKNSRWRYERFGMALAASLAALLIGGVGGHYLIDGGTPAALNTSNGEPGSIEAERLHAFSQGLEHELSGTPVVWKNPDNGSEGTLTPIRTFQTESGQYCREFEEVRIAGGKQHSEGGIACRQDSGEWQVRMRFYPE